MRELYATLLVAIIATLIADAMCPMTSGEMYALMEMCDDNANQAR